MIKQAPDGKWYEQVEVTATYDPQPVFINGREVVPPRICQHCKHWTRLDSAIGACTLIADDYDGLRKEAYENKAYIEGNHARLITEPDFYCGLWEAKDD